MRKIELRIRKAIKAGRWVFTDHAEERLAERGIEEWQVVEGVGPGETLEVHPESKPHPKVLIRQSLADGSTVVTVWAYLKSINSAALITVYFVSR